MGNIAITLRNFINQLVIFGLSSSLALGVVVGVLLLITGGTTAEIDLTFDFGAFDGIWFLIGLPVVTTLVFLLLSPLSFWFHRLLTKRRSNESHDDA